MSVDDLPEDDWRRTTCGVELTAAEMGELDQASSRDAVSGARSAKAMMGQLND